MGKMGGYFLPTWKQPDAGKFLSKAISVMACLPNFCHCPTLICPFPFHTKNLCIISCPKPTFVHSFSLRKDVSFLCYRPRSKILLIPAVLFSPI